MDAAVSEVLAQLRTDTAATTLTIAELRVAMVEVGLITEYWEHEVL